MILAFLFGLLPPNGALLLAAIFIIIFIATLATFWGKRRVYSEDIDDETEQRMKDLKPPPDQTLPSS
jgi:hypothetical protein